jgi:hypothetical protein
MLAVLLVPQLAMARVYMCVDEATGKTSFSDKGCSATTAQAEVKVPATNLNSGGRAGTATAQRTWVSDRDTRKSGRDYSAERRDISERSAAASGENLMENDES